MSTFSKTVSFPFNFHHYFHTVRMMSEEGQCCSTPPFNTTLREKVKSSFYNKDLVSTLEPIQLWNRKTTYKVSNMLKLRSSYQFNWNGSVYNAHVYNSFFLYFYLAIQNCFLSLTVVLLFQSFTRLAGYIYNWTDLSSSRNCHFSSFLSLTFSTFIL